MPVLEGPPKSYGVAPLLCCIQPPLVQNQAVCFMALYLLVLVLTFRTRRGFSFFLKLLGLSPAPLS